MGKRVNQKSIFSLNIDIPNLEKSGVEDFKNWDFEWIVLFLFIYIGRKLKITSYIYIYLFFLTNIFEI